MGGWMPYDRVRHRNGLEWWPEAGVLSPYPARSDSEGYPLPEPGSHYPARSQCWVCDQPVLPERADRGTCSDYHQGVFDADRGGVRDRARRAPRKVPWHGLVGDLNRMERDYLAPPDELIARCGDPDPATECAVGTGADVDVVRAVLTHVFRRGLRR